MLKKITLTTLTTIAAAALTACGGGGGGSATPTTPTAYPVQQALQYAYSHGLQQTLGVTGTAVNGSTTYPVTGSLTFTLGTATAYTFNGTPGYQVPATISGSVTLNGSTVPLNTTSTDYVNASYQPIGNNSGGDYCVATTAFTPPATATVGMTGNLGVFTCYTNSTKTVVDTTDTESYVTTAGSNGNLNFQIIETIRNSSNQVTGSGSTTYAITPAGIPSLVGLVATETTNGVTVNLNAQ